MSDNTYARGRGHRWPPAGIGFFEKWLSVWLAYIGFARANIAVAVAYGPSHPIPPKFLPIAVMRPAAVTQPSLNRFSERL